MKGCPVPKSPRNSKKPGSGIIYVTPVLEDAACIFGVWSQFCFDCYSGAISAISRGPAASGGGPITRSPKKIKNAAFPAVHRQLLSWRLKLFSRVLLCPLNIPKIAIDFIRDGESKSPLWTEIFFLWASHRSC